MQKLSEAPDKKWGDACTIKKEPFLQKGEIRSLQLHPSDWKDFLQSGF